MKSFTILEIVLVLTLIPTFFGLLSYGFLDIYNRYLLDSEKQLLLDLLFKARHRAEINYLGQSHGVSWAEDQYLLFIGTSSSERLSQYDERYPKAKIIQINAPFTEVVFYPLTQKTNASGSIILSLYGREEIIKVNHEGVIEY
jgi:hypothetical protein